MKAVYIHIPYCVKKCIYCDFVSGPPDGPVLPFVRALEKEIETGAADFQDGEPVTSVFFGGGTPTLLPAEYLAEILAAVRSAFPLAPDAEITTECNPGTLSEKKAELLLDAGFNRISVGLQSADDRLLKTIGRIHTRDTFLNAYAALRRAGFSNINVDVMHGLPGQTQENYLDTLRLVTELSPGHISSYALILEEGTPLYAMVQAGQLTLPDEDAAADMQDAGMELLCRCGYERYEISNFARQGYACRHNLTYWKNGPYLGFGPAAHSSYPKNGRWVRRYNTDNTKTYISLVTENKSPVYGQTVISEKEQRFETVMLGLRTTEGVSEADFSRRFGLTVREAFPSGAAFAAGNGLLRRDSPGFFALNARGLDLLNTVLVQFMDEN